MARNRLFSLPLALAIALGVTPSHAAEKALTLLNVSYDPTRELIRTSTRPSLRRGKRGLGKS